MNDDPYDVCQLPTSCNGHSKHQVAHGQKAIIFKNIAVLTAKHQARNILCLVLQLQTEWASSHVFIILETIGYRISPASEDFPVCWLVIIHLCSSSQTH